MQKPHLFSFPLCPFVMRSLILLAEKKVDFDITYIDLQDKPDWFLKISPLGKVPVLKVADEVIFESNVIAEYLDEVYAPSFHPDNPILKAKNRSWIEFGSQLIMAVFGLTVATDKEAYTEKLEQLQEKLNQLEAQVTTPYFNGDEFRLIDAAYAPVFITIYAIFTATSIDLLKDNKNLKQWGQQLLARQSVQSAKPEGYHDKWFELCESRGSYLILQTTK